MCITEIGFLFYMYTQLLRAKYIQMANSQVEGYCIAQDSSNVHRKFWWPRLGMEMSFKHLVGTGRNVSKHPAMHSMELSHQGLFDSNMSMRMAGPTL